MRRTTKSQSKLTDLGNQMIVHKKDKMKKIRKINFPIIVGAIIFIANCRANASSISEVETGKQIVVKPTSRDNYINNWFVKKDVLACGGRDVAIITSCIEKSSDLSYCFSQNVLFIQHEGDIVSNINYNHSFNDGDQQFIAQASCREFNKNYYVILSNTNFSNCKICEWADIFTNNGRYIGSTDGMVDAKNFKRKLISNKYKGITSSPSPNSSINEGANIEIYRVR